MLLSWVGQKLWLIIYLKKLIKFEKMLNLILFTNFNLLKKLYYKYIKILKFYKSIIKKIYTNIYI